MMLAYLGGRTWSWAEYRELSNKKGRAVRLVSECE